MTKLLFLGQMSKKLPKIIAIVGLTASGKSDLALKIAKKISGEIIAADSRTVYREMNIGTAKPKGTRATSDPQTISIKGMFEEKPLLVDDVPHWGFDLVGPDEEFTVADFKTYAEKKILEIVKRGHVPVIVGGTGLYVQALIDNFGFDQTKGEAKYEALQIGIAIDREEVYERIDARVDKMVAEGLVDEVRALREKYGSETKAMTGIGYRQICAFFDGYLKLRDAVDLVKRETRHYAKRQITWFKRDERIVWVKGFDEAMEEVTKFL